MTAPVPAHESPPAPPAPSDHTSHALLLDLDGVLLDTRPVMQMAWRKVQELHGVNLPFHDYERHLGREFGDIMQRLGVTDAETVRRTHEAESVAAAHLAQEFTGIIEMLHAFVAADWRLGVVTSKHVDRTAPLLARLGCPFATARTSAGAGRTKPAPDPLLLALVDLGVDPAAAVYVGDMAVDQESAARAGVAYTRTGWGYGQLTAPAPKTTVSPEELLRLLLPAKQLVEGSKV
ncbi:HAD family hydrolase [Streptomyces zagrosensis]|uniref:HAD superfamily hydrolase (TIGR01549 family) n=1 Tax=Streptomyces zagrosensis TaxID=1042984 RepID=A0A7W9QJ52_9ACTN|nr:HAD-IA family hydrolase [Streptomyces zagrosensis]MBB5940212.1 HAD superfamily hydrolase (TIGR01549 family) [Streptomyces zagrosensis]